MKARLAKKIAHTPVDRLSPRWLDRILGNDERVYEAIRKWRKKKKSEKEALERLRKELKESDELLDKLEREKQREKRKRKELS